MSDHEPTIRWWGPASWGAPICEDVPRVDIPLGQFCLDCHVKIEQYDKGVSIPYARTRSGQYPPIDSSDWLVTMEPHHLECFSRSIGGDLAVKAVKVIGAGRPLTRARVLELREQLWTVPEIAQEFDRSEEEVRELLRSGTT